MFVEVDHALNAVVLVQLSVPTGDDSHARQLAGVEIGQMSDRYGQPAEHAGESAKWTTLEEDVLLATYGQYVVETHVYKHEEQQIR
jgi:hypothetical protein